MNNLIYTEIDYSQNNKWGYPICGDVILSKRFEQEGRLLTILSDGLGSGVKANVLSTLTASMAVNFSLEHEKVKEIAENIMNTLPVCSVRKISYSTFTIIDIDCDGETRILEYDNPGSLVIRNGRVFEPECEILRLKSSRNLGKKLRFKKFKALKEDRLIFCSDGIYQSGIGSEEIPFGWGEDSVKKFVTSVIGNDPSVSAGKLSKMILKESEINDSYKPQDDSSCGVIYFRNPRKMLIATGPPFDKNKDAALTERILNFKGKKVVCGGTTAQIISRESRREIEISLKSVDPEIPPSSSMEGIDLITEGILTLGKLSKVLESRDGLYSENRGGPVSEILSIIAESDLIDIIVGTRINNAHQDPTLPVELEIRRNVIKRIKRVLEKRYLKRVNLFFI